MSALTTLNCPSCSKPVSPGTKFCATCGQKLAQLDPETTDPLIGKFVGDRYQVQDKLGEGGMGAVYRAEQVAMKRPVALKVLHPHLSQDQELVERFHREAAACSRLNHPNTITVHDFGQTEDGTLYIAMEFVDGTSLADEVDTIASLPWTRAVHIVLQVAESLADAHASGIVHRDLKPDNIMLINRAGQTDFVKLLDFGIAKVYDAGEDQRKALTRTGMIFGTPQYMSPEQIRSSGVDHKTDIYALGVILYQLLTGDLPFSAENPMGLLTKHLMEPPRPMAQTRPGVDCPRELEAMVMRCLAKDPNGRYQSMNEVVATLAALAGDTRPGFAVQTPLPASVGSSGAPPVLGTGFGQQPGQASYGPGAATPLPIGGPGTPMPFAANTGSGVTPAPVSSGAPSGGGAGKAILLTVLIVGLLAGVGVGGAFAWRELAHDSSDDDSPSTGGGQGQLSGTGQTGQAAQTGQTGQAAQTGQTGQAAQTGQTGQAATVHPGAYGTPGHPGPYGTGTTAQGLATTQHAATGAANPNAQTAQTATMAPQVSCVVQAGSGPQSTELAKAVSQREEQIRLCLSGLLSKTFDGSYSVRYRYGGNKGLSNFSNTKNSLGGREVAICLETVVKMVNHPSSRRQQRASFKVTASGGGGQLKACKIKAAVGGRRKTGPKPPGWTHQQWKGYGGY